MSIFAPLLASIKSIKGEELTRREKIGLWWYNLWQYTWGFKHLRDFKYTLKNLLWERYDLIRTGLPKSKYCDKPVIMLYGMMSLVVDFVEKEKCFERIDFNSTTHWQEVGETVKQVYDWWKDYPNRQKEISIALNNWHNAKFSDCPPGETLNWLNKNDTEQSKRYGKIHDALEDKLQQEEQEMLMKVVKIRQSLWT